MYTVQFEIIGSSVSGKFVHLKVEETTRRSHAAAVRNAVRRLNAQAAKACLMGVDVTVQGDVSIRDAVQQFPTEGRELAFALGLPLTCDEFNSMTEEEEQAWIRAQETFAEFADDVEDDSFGPF